MEAHAAQFRCCGRLNKQGDNSHYNWTEQSGWDKFVIGIHVSKHNTNDSKQHEVNNTYIINTDIWDAFPSSNRFFFKLSFSKSSARVGANCACASGTFTTCHTQSSISHGASGSCHPLAWTLLLSGGWQSRATRGKRDKRVVVFSPSPFFDKSVYPRWMPPWSRTHKLSIHKDAATCTLLKIFIGGMRNWSLG